jgi:hypothetical protein
VADVGTRHTLPNYYPSVQIGVPLGLGHRKKTSHATVLPSSSARLRVGSRHRPFPMGHPCFLPKPLYAVINKSLGPLRLVDPYVELSARSYEVNTREAIERVGAVLAL